MTTIVVVALSVGLIITSGGLALSIFDMVKHLRYHGRSKGASVFIGSVAMVFVVLFSVYMVHAILVIGGKYV